MTATSSTSATASSTPAPSTALLSAQLHDPAGNIPAEMRAERRWVVFRIFPSTSSGNKSEKIPFCSSDVARNASPSDPSTWSDFATALDAVHRDPRLHLGFALGGGYAGVDLDECRDAATGVVEPSAAAIISRLDSYTEPSVSETGVHVICKGELPPGGRRKDDVQAGGRGKIEMYDHARFFITTGEGPAAPVAERAAELASLHAEVFGEKTAAPVLRVTPVAALGGLTDDELHSRIRRSPQGATFSALWSGDRSGYPSDSEADLALCGILAWWTGKDASRIDRLFRMSGLYREKWNRDDYRGRTIDQAIAGAGPGYQPSDEPMSVAPKSRKRFSFHTHQDLLARPPARFLVKDVIDDGSFVALVAKPGLYKTFLALDLALSVASGQSSWLGYRINRHGPVVYVGGEGIGRLKQRVLAWMKHHELSVDIPNFRWLDDSVALVNSGDSTQFIEDVAALQPVLVIFDTLSRSMCGADENSQKDMTRLVAAVDALRAKTGCTVLMIHHLNAAGTRERGSTVLTGGVDTTLRLDPATTGYVTVTCSKQKDAAELAPLALKPFAVTLEERDPDTGEPIESIVLVTASQFDLMKAERTLWDNIEKVWLANPMLSRDALARAIKGRKTTVLNAIDRMEAEGLLRFADRSSRRRGRKRDPETIH